MKKCFKILICYLSFITLNLAAAESITTDEISDWDTRFELAKVLTYQKAYDEALLEYQKLQKEKPNNSVVRIEIAKIFYYKKQYKEALEEIAQIPSNETTEESDLLLADISLAQKDYPKAEHIYHVYLDKHPAADAVRLKLAELLSWQKRYPESIAEYKKILTNRPNDIQVRRKYAAVLIWMGKEKEAAEELKKTLK